MKLKISPTYKQSLAWKAWKNPAVDDVIFGGAAGGGKSRFLTEAIAHNALCYPGTKYFLARKELDTLMKTTYVTLTQIVLKAWGLNPVEGNMPKSGVWDPGAIGHYAFNGSSKILYFYNGSQISFLHLEEQPNDPLFDRFGSHEYTQGGIDEMSEIAFRAYDVLRSRVGRWKNVEYGLKGKIGGTLNPSQEWPYRIFYDPWKKAGRPNDPNLPLISMKGILDGVEVHRTFVFIQALAGDNEHVGREYEVNLATIQDQVLRARLQQGDWEFSSAVDTLFDAATIADLFTVTAAPSREKFLTVDVARTHDLVVLNHWRGWKSFKIEVHDPKKEGKIAVHQTAEFIRNACAAHGIPREHVLIDQDGVGGGVFDLVPGCLGFSGNAAPFGVVGEKEVKEQYENLRAQCVYHTSEKAANRQLAVTAKNIETRELLAADLAQFKRRDALKTERKLKVTQKEDIKKALGRSPDVGDTVWMRAYFDLRLRDEALQANGTMSVWTPDYDN